MYEIRKTITNHKEPLAEYTPNDPDLVEPSPSTGWRETYAIFHIHMDRLAGATRKDRPERYRRKHAWGVSS